MAEITNRSEEHAECWEEDVPLYRVACETPERGKPEKPIHVPGAKVALPAKVTREEAEAAGTKLVPVYEARAGTNYPVQRKGQSVAIVRVSFSCPLSDVPFEEIAREVQAALLRRASSGEAYQADLLLGGLDTPASVPGNEPKWDEAITFWFSPFENAPRPALAIRTRYRQSVVAALKKSIANEKARLHSSRVGNYLADWGKIWFVDEWRAIPNVLGALAEVGMRVVFIPRTGFPAAPPIAANTEGA